MTDSNYVSGPAVVTGPGGEYTQSWPDPDSVQDKVYYELKDDDPTPFKDIRAAITPGVHWERVALVLVYLGILTLTVFTVWAVL